MKSQNVHLLLGVLLFTSLCGAPRDSRVKVLKSAKSTTEDKMPGVFGVMSNARMPKAKPGSSPLRKECDSKIKNEAATKIQKVVRGNQVRKQMKSSDSSTSASSSRSSSRSPKSTPRVASKKAQKAAKEAPVVDPTEDFIG